MVTPGGASVVNWPLVKASVRTDVSVTSGALLKSLSLASAKVGSISVFSSTRTVDSAGRGLLVTVETPGGSKLMAFVNKLPVNVLSSFVSLVDTLVSMFDLSVFMWETGINGDIPFCSSVDCTYGD